MSQENGTYSEGATPETEPAARFLSKRYEALIDEIHQEAKDDPYWTTPQRLEDGESGLAPINIVSTLLRIADKLKGNRG